MTTVHTKRNAEDVTGYLHPTYAESLAEFGTPVFLPASQGWILRRQIPGTPYHDAMGCYPLFTCRDWSRLETDLASIGTDLVSLALVADPFGDYEDAGLKRCFTTVFPFKEHFIVDLSLPVTTSISAHHRYYGRKAQRAVRVELCPDPTRFLDEWLVLYENLKARQGIRGIAEFSKRAFEVQMQVPGAVMFRGVCGGNTVGMMIWYVWDRKGYWHLSAYSQAGYQLRASYALLSYAIEYFGAEGCRWLDLGANAGLSGNSEDGLAQFKRGWATGTRPAYFCGRTFHQDTYDEICRKRGGSPTKYFPAYRSREFS